MSTNVMSSWDEKVRAICGAFETRYSRDPHLFVGQISKAALGGVEVAFISSNADWIAQEGSFGGSRHEADCFLVLQRRGQMEIEVGDQVLHLREGDLALLDSTQAFKMVPHGLFSHVSIHLPRDVVKGDRKGRSCKLTMAGACGQLLGTLVRQIAEGELSRWSRPEDGDGIRQAIVALLDSVLRYPAELHAPMIQLHQVKTLIDQRLDSLTLTPQTLTRELGISSRQLYRLFEATGDSVCRYILRERIGRAAQAMRNPAYKHRSITEICLLWGFADSAHFSKVFKKEMGCNPRDFRRGTGGSLGVELQRSDSHAQVITS